MKQPSPCPSPARASLSLAVAVVAMTAGHAHAQGDPPADKPPAAPSAAPAGQPTPPSATPKPSSPQGAPGNTGAAPSMGLAQVLQVAVRQKPSLAQAAIDIEIAEASMQQIMGLDDWFISATGGWSSTRLQAFNLDQDVLSLQGDLSRRLSTGGTVSLSADTNYTRAVTSASNPACLDMTTGQPIPGCEPADIDIVRNVFTHTLSATLSQPLWRDRGKRITYIQRDKARVARDSAFLAQRIEANSAVRQVVIAYWELAYAWRDLEIRKNSMALTQERLKNTRAGIEAGAFAPIEALAVEQNIVSREEDILNAEQTVSQRSLTLRRLAGLEIGRHAIDMRASAPLAFPDRSFDIDELLTRALAASPTLAQLQTQEQDVKLDVELAENGLLPELNLLLSFGPRGSGDDPATALKNMAQFDDLALTANLTYRRSLQRSGAKGATASARARLRKQRVGIADVKAQIASQLVLTVKRATAAKKRFELGARAIELAKKNIEAEKARFELGGSTNFDVLQRQDDLERAQLRQARALIDFMNAIADIDSLTGDILPAYGIELTAEE